MTVTNTKVSDLLKRIRFELGKSQLQLSNDIGITQSNLSQYEKMRKFPRSFNINKIVKYANKKLRVNIEVESLL